MRRFPSDVLRFVSAWALCLVCVSPALALDVVSPATGRVTLESVDAWLATPLGEIAVSRAYDDSADGGTAARGWAIDLALRIEASGDRRAFLLQGARSIAVLESRDGVSFDGDGLRARRTEGRWELRTRADSLSLFDGAGREIARTDRNGNRIDFGYDASGRLARVAAVAERPLTFAYDPQGRLEAIRDDAGRTCTYRYDAAGRLAAAVAFDGAATEYGYTPDGRLATVAETGGERVSFAYDERGRVIERVSSRNGALKFTFGATTRVTRNDGYWREIESDRGGLPLRRVDSQGRRESWTWDAERRLTSRTHADGSTSAYAYDAAGRLVRQSSSSSGDAVLSIAYDGESERPATINLGGAVTRFEYDAQGRATRHVSPAGRATRFAWDAQGRRVAVTDAAGRTTRFAFDAAGSVVSRTDPDGNVAAWEYDPAGRLVRERDPLGAVWSYRYTPQGRLASIAGPAGTQVDYVHDAAGRLVEARANGQSVRYRYDDAGRTAGVDDGAGGSLALAYDAVGNLARVTDSLGRTTATEFDALGRPVRTTLPSGLAISRQYGAGGALASIDVGMSRWSFTGNPGDRALRVTDAAGGAATITRDAFGRVTSVVRPGGGQQQWRYDVDGLVASVVTATQDAWSYRYGPAGDLDGIAFPGDGSARFERDHAGRITGLTYPWGGSIALRHDETGQVVERRAADGRRAEYRYDAEGRLVACKMPDAEWSYRYDAAGRLVEAGGRDYAVRYTYDGAGRIVRVDHPQWRKTIAYAYDAAGRLASRTNPDGSIVRFAYDVLGRTAAIESGSGRHTFAWDDHDRVARLTAPNGTSTRFEYDAAGRVVAVAHADASGKPFAARRYRHDADGNRIEATDANGRVARYRYDVAGQLVAESTASGTRDYEVGPAGNRRSVRNAAGKDDYRYDAGERLVQAGEAAFAWDAGGQLASRRDAAGTSRYEFDAEGRLARVQLPSGKAVRYGYGPFGERIWREEDGRRTYFVHDGDDVLAELGDGFEVRRTWLYAGTDNPLAVVSRDGGPWHFHADDLGSVLAATDAGGKVVARYAFDAFGNAKAEGATGALPPPRFAGRPLDVATGLYDMRARQYDPRVGRFISPDPVLGELEDPMSLAPYVYARNNPLRYLDRFGEASVAEAVAYDPIHDVLAGRPLQPPPMATGHTTTLNEGNLQRWYIARELAGQAKQRQAQADRLLAEQQWRARNANPPRGFDARTVSAGSPRAYVGQAVGAVRSTIASMASRASSSLRSAGTWVESHARPLVAGAQRLANVSGHGLAAIRMADIAGEAYYSDDPSSVIADRGLEFAAMAAASAAMTPVTLAVAAIAPASVTVGGAVIGAAALTVTAADRVLAASQEHLQRDLAGQRADRAEQQAAQTTAQVQDNRDRSLADLRNRDAELTQLRTALEAMVAEASSLELEAANERNAAQAKAERAAAVIEAVKGQKGALDAAGLLGKIDIAKLKSMLAAIEALAKQACAEPPVSNRDALATQAEQQAKALESAAKPDEVVQAAAKLEAEASDAESYANEAEEIRAGIESHRRAIESRLALVSGDGKARYVDMLGRARALQTSVVGSGRRLAMFLDRPDEKDALAKIVERAARELPRADALDSAARSMQKSLDATKVPAELASIEREARATVPVTRAALRAIRAALAAAQAIAEEGMRAAAKARDCASGRRPDATPATGARACATDSDCPVGEICGPQKTCVPAPTVPPVRPQRQDDTGEPSPGGGATRRPPAVCNYINIAPRPSEVRPGETVTFTATAVFTDSSTRDVTALVQWQPGPRNSYTAPPDLRFNQRVVVRASLGECTGSIEFTALAPSWSPPLSHADDLGARGQQPGPADYTWYALCKKGTGEVVYGESTDPTRYFIMGGPFPGPRNAQFWIEQNCPRWRCTDSGACAVDPARSPGPGWYVVCDKDSLRVYATENYVATRHWILQERLYGAPEADLWIERNCPGRLCTHNGACAAGQLRTGGRWAVVCSKSHGGVALTEYPNRVDQWVWVENLFSEIDARAWANQNCPSWRCDRDGKCLPGAAASVDDALRLFGERDATRQAERGGSATFGIPGSGGFTASDLQDAMQSGQPLPGHGHAGAGTGTGTPAGAGAGGPGAPSGGTTTTPQPGTTPPPTVPEQTQWYGIETKVVYDWQGRRCTLTDAYEGQSTPSGLASLTNTAQGKALGPIRGAGGRTVLSVTSRVYAGPAATKPSYTGKTGVACENPSGSGGGTPSPSSEKKQDYLFEAVVAYEKNDIVTGVGPRTVPCTLTGYMVYTIGASEVQASLRDWGQKTLGVVRGNDKAKNGRLASTRVVSGPSAHIPYPNPQHKIACQP